jgi:transcriptional regulator with XRE-family HTH domain
MWLSCHAMNDKNCPNLRIARENKGLTQKQARSALKVSLSTVCGWERGTHNPPLRKLKEMAALYGVTTDFLLGHSQTPDGQADSRHLKVVPSTPAGPQAPSTTELRIVS